MFIGHIIRRDWIIFCMAYFQRDPRRSVTLFLLTVLAVADFMFLVPMAFLLPVIGMCQFVDNCSPALQNVAYLYVKRKISNTNIFIRPAYLYLDILSYGL